MNMGRDSLLSGWLTTWVAAAFGFVSINWGFVMQLALVVVAGAFGILASVLSAYYAHKFKREHREAELNRMLTALLKAEKITEEEYEFLTRKEP